MSACTCPADGRQVPSAKRVVVLEPKAVVRKGGSIIKDPNKVHIFHADCPKHGYQEIEVQTPDVKR